MKKIFALLFAVALTSSEVFSQEKWTVSIEPQKRFIENKSQFDGRNELPGTEILYGVDWGSTQIYFSKYALTFFLFKKEQKDEEHEREVKKKIREGKLRPEDVPELHKKAVVHLQWLNANPSARLLPLDPAPDYFSYAAGEKDALRSISSIKGYERLLYENLYPNIDVEYAFHPEGGIKYKIILHPGADVSMVKMNYEGAENIRIDESGNIRIATEAGEIIDHAPLSFYEKKNSREIPSRYIATGNTVSFELESFKTGKTVIIDPWVATPTMPSINKVYYVKSDSSGNAYAYGGDTPYRIQKYNSSGSLVWTYNSPWSAANNWFGGLAVDPDGNSVITSGTGVSISKVDSTGNLVWSNSGGNFYEYWNPSFNCDYSQIVVGGTWLQNVFAFQFYGAVFDINPNTGAQNSYNLVAGTLVGAPNTPPFIANEVRSICFSPNGNYYFLTLDTVGSVSQSFTINHRQKSGYNLSYYLPYGQGGTGQGVNAIAATPYFIYTSNGQVLNMRDASTGNLLNSVFIPSGAVEVCSGIAVDSCGNVYVGAVGKVVKYDANLNLITSASTPAEVYDVSVSTNGEVFACGPGFVASLDLSACNQVRNVCVTPFPVVITKTDVSCFGECNGTATATPSGGVPPYTYYWSNGQTTSTATNLCAGSYVVTVTDSTNSYSIASVVITEPPSFTVSVTSSVTVCGTSATATPVSGITPYSYQWSNGSTSAGISGLATGIYSVTVIDGNGCSATGSISVTQSPGLTASASVTNPACGICDGTATAIAVGGNPPFAYSWSTGDSLSTSSNLCAGVYNVTISETTGGGNAVFWSENFSAGSAGWTLNNNSGSNGTAPNRWVVNNNTSSGCAACPVSGSGGNFLHITCDDASLFCAPMGGPSCVYGQGFPFLFDNSTDRFASTPNISTIGKTNITLTFWYVSAGDTGKDYGLVRLSNDGGLSWTDLPAHYAAVLTCTQAIISVPAAYEDIPNFRIGFRWINDNDLNGNDPPFMIDDIELSAPVAPCSATASIIVNSDSSATAAVDSVKNVSCKNGSDGAIFISVSGGNLPYDYLWSNNDSVEDISGLTAGTYQVTVTDSSDCVTIQNATLSEPDIISIAGTVTNASCTSGGAINITVTGGTSPYAYSWSNAETTEDLINVPPGAHVLSVTDFNSCVKTASFNIGSPGINLQLTATDGTCGGVNDCSIASSVFGGSPPYHYIWSNNDTTANLLAIERGTYTLTVTDNSGCSATKSATVVSPDVLTMIASITRVLCQGGNDGGIKLIPSGGTPDYTALWSNGQTELTLTGLAPDVYSVTVTDSNGCTADSSFSLTSVSVYTIETASTNASCDGSPTGSAEVNILSGNSPPYSYLWSTGATTSLVSGLSPGSYSVIVKDSFNCIRNDTTEVGRGLKIDETVIRPCPAEENGSIITTVTGGVPPYNYTWTPGGATTASLSNISEGVYSLTVSDQNDCKGSDTIIVTSDTNNVAFCDTLIFYDVFTPNGDGVNDWWVIDGVHRFPDNEIQIFNRWGGKVWSGKSYDNVNAVWKGENEEGELLPSATYYYILKLHDVNETVYSGNITLIR